MGQFSTALSRRHALGLMAACGVSMSLRPMSARAASKRSFERPRSLVTLWMNGGMSQLETWDPHSGTETGGDTKSIATSVNGLQISDFLPQMAEQMDKVTLIRSLTSTEGDHARGSAFVKTGYRLETSLVYPALGAIAAHELRDKQAEIPQHISLGGDNFFPRGGYLGNKWDAFRVLDPGRSMTNMKSGVSVARMEKRKQGLDFLGKQFTQSRPSADRDTLHSETIQSALKMMSSEQLKAFDLDEESSTVKAAYGDSRFGRGCLVARRLVETGVRAVEVCLNGFDTHVDNHNGQKTQADMLDPAFATLLQELEDRDLLESTVVLCITEFGRTPRINAAGGRDHFPHWFSAVVAGGGFRRGLTIGKTPGTVPPEYRGGADEKRPRPEDPVTVPDLYATIMHSMGIPYDEEFVTHVGRPITYSSGQPIARLLDERSARSI